MSKPDRPQTRAPESAPSAIPPDLDDDELDEPEDAAPSEWRRVEPDETFEPGRSFRVDVGSGQTEVLEPPQHGRPRQPLTATPAELAATVALRATLWQHGWRPVPVYSASHPDEAQRGKAPLGAKWPERAAQNPPECVRLAAAVPWALNTGVLAAGLRPLDLDIDNPALATAVRELAFTMLGRTIVRTRENAPRALLVYRAAQGEPQKIAITGATHTKDNACKIEALGRGQQFVGYGQHPSGFELQWLDGGPDATPISAVPAITEAQLHSFLTACAPLIGAEPPRRSDAERPPRHANGQDGAATAHILDVIAALAVLPNNDPADWEFWNSTGMATWVASGGSIHGLNAWCAWSAQHPEHDVAACRERWNHYPTSPPDRTGAGKLFAMARAAMPGWQLPSEPRSNDRRAEQARPETPDDWPAPLDFFTDNEAAPPELRSDHVPTAIWVYAKDAGERMGVDPTSLALGELVSCASVISDEWRIQPKRYDTTWIEQARLWAAIVGGPSTLKTPVISTCTLPIDRLDAEARERHQEEMRAYKAEMKAWKASEDDDIPEPRRPRLTRYLVEGTTIEALSEVLRDDEEAYHHAPAQKVLARHDEMAELIANLDRYRAGGRGGGDRGAYLRLYNGGRHTIDRIGRGSFAVPNWSACLLAGVQPEPIQRIAKTTDDDGLLQRFMYSVPGACPPGVDRRPDPNARQRYEGLFPQLTALHPPRPPGGGHPCVVVLHEQAQPHRENIEALARAMAALPDTSPRLEAALGKWPGLFGRLCLTFHIVNIADARQARMQGPFLEVVPEATARQVARFMHEILLPNLLRAERLMFGTAQAAHAQWIAGFILTHRMHSIATRDIVRAYRALAAPEAKDELAAVMASLVAIGWLEPVAPKNPVKPLAAWAVNPAVHIAFEARAEREREQRDNTREQLAADIEVLRQLREAAGG